MIINLDNNIYKKGHIIKIGKGKLSHVVIKEPNKFTSFIKKLFKVKYPYKYELQNNTIHPDCFTSTIIDFLIP